MPCTDGVRPLPPPVPGQTRGMPVASHVDCAFRSGASLRDVTLRSGDSPARDVCHRSSLSSGLSGSWLLVSVRRGHVLR